MKVAIDIRRMKDFGVGTYIRNVVRNLGRLDEQTQFFLIGPAHSRETIGPLPANFRNVVFEASDTSFAGWTGFRAILRRLRCDLVHIPHLYWLPRGLPCPYIVTVHDVLEYLERAPGETLLQLTLHFNLTRKVVRSAARLLAVSEFTRSELETLFHLPGDRAEVVHNAIDERFLCGHASQAEKQMIAERYQVNYPFLLYAGRIRPQKNVGRIIEAFSVLKGELAKEGKFEDLKLIIIGDEVSSHPDLRRTVVRGGVSNDVRFLGFVPIDVLRIFYDAAKVFVFPSLYEGFGLPPLEAMAHGTPVVTSNTSSLPEVVGDAAVLVNPDNVFEITRALRRVLLDQSLREKMKERGYEQARCFSWEASVRRILEVYREVAAA
ncbi:MAG TPA: glycosyltransferase family 1 protein [Candidatus Acidoferrales bacterium]|nr:glycosyltransferase family 1 protein [Candidatus Acidoferrales bacterium]